MGMNIHRYKYDWLMAIGIIVVLFSIYGGLVFSQKTHVKESQLALELNAFRAAVAMFYEINDRVPEDLNELANAYYYNSKRMKTPYLEKRLMEKIMNGKIVDPFGEPYVYDKVKGLVVTESEEKLK